MIKEIYLAYFDLLGFKEFIQNNSETQINIRMAHFFRDIELALTYNHTKPNPNNPHELIADLSYAKLNCLNISDTVLYWTNECNIELLNDLIITCFLFNTKFNMDNFPVRGCIIKGTMNKISGEIRHNSNNTSYSVQCPYGKALVNAHIKAESQSWAGTVLDGSIVNDLLGTNYQSILTNYCHKYNVPYKTPINKEEYVLKLVENIQSPEAFSNAIKSIYNVFNLDNKSTDSVKIKIYNTIRFIDFIYKN